MPDASHSSQRGTGGTPAAIWRGASPFVYAAAIAFVLHRYIGPWSGPFASKLMLDVGINIILAVSLNIVNGYTGQFSLGHAGFMAVGGYMAGFITYYSSMRIWGNSMVHGGLFGPSELIFVGACLAGGLAAALAGYVVGVASLRLRGDYLAIVTLGFGEILRVLLQSTDDVLTNPAEIARTPISGLANHLGGALGFGGLPFDSNIFWVYIFVCLTVAVAYRLKISSYGRAFLSIREDETAAESLGVPVFNYKVRAFVIAAFFAGIAGGLFGHEIGTTLNPAELGFMRSIEIVIMVVLGGMGSISGSILAATLLTLLPELLREFAEWRMIVYALSLILIMILRPKGIFGLHEIWDWKGFRRLLPKRGAA